MHLKELLAKRTDFDMAMYHLGCCLGLMEHNNFGKYLGMLNSKNDISDMLYEILERMVKLKILEENDYGYLWNKNYQDD